MLNLFQHLSIGLSSLKFCFNQIDRFRPIRDILHEIKRFRQKQSTKFGMTNFNERFAFTLSELLLSLIIVGVVAIITVPVLINNVQKKLFAAQVKNFVAQIEQLAQDELLAHRTRDLSNTDFANPALLLSDKHFEIAKSCTVSNFDECWKNRYSYKQLNKVRNSVAPGFSAILKNGATVRVRYDNGLGEFCLDVNGKDKPNIWGRDIFIFYIGKKGHISDYVNAYNKIETYDGIKQKCQNSNSGIAPFYCYAALVRNNWKMDY